MAKILNVIKLISTDWKFVNNSLFEYAYCKPSSNEKHIFLGEYLTTKCIGGYKSSCRKRASRVTRSKIFKYYSLNDTSGTERSLHCVCYVWGDEAEAPATRGRQHATLVNTLAHSWAGCSCRARRESAAPSLALQSLPRRRPARAAAPRVCVRACAVWRHACCPCVSACHRALSSICVHELHH